jgi:hypothetical protein
MTDTPFRVYGPGALSGTLYTVPSGVQKFFIRDVSLTNIGSSATRAKLSIGDISIDSNLVYSADVAATSLDIIRPLWLLDVGETFQGKQTIDDAITWTSVTTSDYDADDTTDVTASWVPAADTLYILWQVNGAASGTTALNPSSISGNGSWTLIGQTTTSVAATTNIGVSAWYWYSSTAGASATTTVTFASAQHSGTTDIFSISNVWKGTSAIPPWTSTATPIVQATTATDGAVAPGSTASSLAVTLSNPLQTGYVAYLCARGGDAGTATPPTGFTEQKDHANIDGTGSVAHTQSEMSSPTTLPGSSTTLGPATFSVATTFPRASIGFELVPSNFIVCTVNGIEVR